MKVELESAWDGREALTEALDRDYAAMKGDGWDLIWEPTSPLTVPWEDIIALRGTDVVDSEVFVPTAFDRPKGPRRQPMRILKDWADEYGGSMVQFGGKLTSGGHWRVSQRSMRPRKK